MGEINIKGEYQKKAEEKYKMYICRDCGQEIHSKGKPQPIRWTDGHVCYFHLAPGEETSK